MYPMKLENLKEIGDFLDRYYLPKLNVDQIINFNGSIPPIEMEALIKISNQKIHRPNNFRAEYYLLSNES